MWSDALTRLGSAGRRASSPAVALAVAIVGAFAITAGFFALLGYDVGRAFETLLLTSFRTRYGVVQTLTKFVPVLLMAYAFAVPRVAGRSNIGGEGQLMAGGIGAVAVGLTCSWLPGPALSCLALAAGVVCGAVWGGFAGWLLHRFGIHEILSTVLGNFVALGLVNWVATAVWPDPGSGHPMTLPILAGARLPMVVDRPPLHAGLLVALVLGSVVSAYVRFTVGGYELAATGANPAAARVHGIDVRWRSFVALALGGALAGLAGAIEVAGVHRRLVEGFHSNFLTLGILVGLLSGGRLRLVPAVAFLISVLEVGAGALQRTMAIPVEIVLVVEALVLILVLVVDRTGARR